MLSRIEGRYASQCGNLGEFGLLRLPEAVFPSLSPNFLRRADSPQTGHSWISKTEFSVHRGLRNLTLEWAGRPAPLCKLRGAQGRRSAHPALGAVLGRTRVVTKLAACPRCSTEKQGGPSHGALANIISTTSHIRFLRRRLVVRVSVAAWQKHS